MRTWVAISHSKKPRHWISRWFKWICAIFGENKRFSYISLWFLLTFASDACLWVCAFTHSFDMVKPNPLIPCLSFLISQWPFSTVLAYPPLPAMAGREQKSYGKMLTQFYPGSLQVQEGGCQESVRTCQLHSDAGDELVDIWMSASRAAGHPETLGKCRGTLCPTRSKAGALGCLSLLPRVQRLFWAIQLGML